MSIKEGSVVRLKSGGPVMTVDWIELHDSHLGATIHCGWFADGDNQYYRAEIMSTEALEEVTR